MKKNRIEKIAILINPVIALVCILVFTGFMLKEHGWKHDIIKLCLFYMLPFACLGLGIAIGMVIKNTPANHVEMVKFS